MKLSPIFFAAVTLAGLANAQTFEYQASDYPPDVLIGIRQTGNPNEIVMDAGSISQFTGATPGSSFKVTAVDSLEIARVYGTSLDSLGFAVFCEVGVAGTPPPSYPTVWVSRARSSRDIQTKAWNRGSRVALGNLGSRIEGIGVNAASYSLGNPVGPDNNATLTVIPSVSNQSYSQNVGSGNFSGTLQGNAETYLPAGFGPGSPSVRADFFQIDLGSGPSTFIGTFDFTENNELWFTAPGGTVAPAPAPTIQGLVRNGSTNTVTFTTVAGPYTYTLMRAPALNPTAPIAQWTAVPGASTPGTGKPTTLSDSSDANSEFYQIQVKP